MKYFLYYLLIISLFGLFRAYKDLNKENLLKLETYGYVILYLVIFPYILYEELTEYSFINNKKIFSHTQIIQKNDTYKEASFIVINKTEGNIIEVKLYRRISRYFNLYKKVYDCRGQNIISLQKEGILEDDVNIYNSFRVFNKFNI